MEGKGGELNLNKNKFSLMLKKTCASTKSVCSQVIHKESTEQDEKLLVTPEPKHLDSILTEVSTQSTCSSSSLFSTFDEKPRKTQNTDEFLFTGTSKFLDFNNCGNLLPAKRPHKFHYKPEQDLDQILNRIDNSLKESFFDRKSIIEEELEVNHQPKFKTCEFLSKIKKQATSTKGSYNFVKGFLKNDPDDDFLEVLPPRSLEGFVVKRNARNPRDVMIENLRNSINNKKTSCLVYEDIFSKPQTDLPGKKQKITENFNLVERFDVCCFKGCIEDSGAESISTAESFEVGN
jgi:hypothetical protein